MQCQQRYLYHICWGQLPSQVAFVNDLLPCSLPFAAPIQHQLANAVSSSNMSIALCLNF